MLAKTELFPPRIRALAVGFPYAVVTGLLGGSTEYVALQLKTLGHESYFFWYVSAFSAISLIVYLIMPETRGRPDPA